MGRVVDPVGVAVLTAQSSDVMVYIYVGNALGK